MGPAYLRPNWYLKWRPTAHDVQAYDASTEFTSLSHMCSNVC